MVARADQRMWSMARYLIELVLIELIMLKHSPLKIAATAMFLSIRIIYNGTWTEELMEASGYAYWEIRDCAADMFTLLRGIKRCSLQSVQKKFSQTRFYSVSCIEFD